MTRIKGGLKGYVGGKVMCSNIDLCVAQKRKDKHSHP